MSFNITWFHKNNFTKDILRQETIESLKNNKYHTEEKNFFNILSYPFSKNSVSSDSVVNFFILSFFFFVNKNHTFLINGLGFLEISKKINRRIIFILFFINKNKKFLIQNYRDFRFIRRFFKIDKIYWMPGSITNTYIDNKNDNKGIFTILRKKKSTNFLKKLNKIRISEVITIYSLDEIKFNSKNILLKGFKSKEYIFSNHSKFLYLYCYGDGVPKSLIESLCNNLEIMIDKKSYLNFGFYKKNLFEIKENRQILNLKNLNLQNTREYYNNGLYKIMIDVINI